MIIIFVVSAGTILFLKIISMALQRYNNQYFNLFFKYRCKKVYSFLEKQIFFNFILRILLESYLEYALDTFINIKFVRISKLINLKQIIVVIQYIRGICCFCNIVYPPCDLSSLSYIYICIPGDM
jgi:hypothetical protein